MKYLLLLCALTAYAGVRTEKVIADFEGKTWAGWQSRGDAFGDEPYRPTGFDGVSQYQGSGIAFSGRASFALKGTLTSPPFVVERDYISFLVAGEREPASATQGLSVDDCDRRHSPVAEADGASPALDL